MRWRKLTTGLLAKCWPERGERRLGIFALAIVSLAALTLSSTATRFTKEALGNHGLLGRVNRHLNPFRSRAALNHCGLPTYDLKIKPAEYRKVLALVEQAKAQGRLTDDLKEWSRAKLIHDGVSYDVKVRVRGDLRDHWENPRKSWRIRFGKQEPFQGQRELNLILPSSNNGLTQSYVSTLARHLGMLAPRDGFALLRINGAPQGVYYQMEHWDGPLLAHQRRPESAIFTNHRNGLEVGSFKALVSKENNDAALQALQLMLDAEVNPTPENLRTALALNDIDDLLRFITCTTLLRADHTSLLTDNHKLYYDTSRGLFYRFAWDFEPDYIPVVQRFDHEGALSTFDIYARYPMSQLRIAALRNPQYRLRRDRMLWELVRDNTALNLFDRAYAGVDFAFWSDVMGRGDEVERLDTYRKLVQRNAQIIRKCLSANFTELRVRHESDRLSTLQFAVNNPAGVRITELQVTGAAPRESYELKRDTNVNGTLDPQDQLVARGIADAEGRVTLAGLGEQLLPKTEVAEDYAAYLFAGGAAGASYQTKQLKTVIFPKTARYDYFLARGSAEAGGDSPKPTVTVSAYNAVTDEPLADDDLVVCTFEARETFEPTRRLQTVEAFLIQHPEFHATAIGKPQSGVTLPRGEHEFAQTVVVPEGVALTIDAGTTIRLRPGVSIVCFGPVQVKGTAASPVRIVPSGSDPWGTFAVVRPGGLCAFEHLDVSGGGSATVDGIIFTGALAVHDGDAELTGCRLHHCVSEDALNIKNGRVRLADSLFAHNASDALDLDFVEGEVVGCHFLDQGGDAVDLSGSTVTVADNRIERAGDKGISAGEACTVTITNNLVLSCTFGIVVKDHTQATVNGCTLIGNQRALAAYAKKPFFGPAHASVRDCIILDSPELILTQGDSTVRLENCIVPGHSPMPGCRPADADLILTLRSNGFVYCRAPGETERAAGAGDPGPTQLGIAAPPVDLR